MKGYTDYMEQISVDTALHEKIMSRIRQKPALPNRRRAMLRAAGMAACAAVLLLCVWVVSGPFGSRDIPRRPDALASNGPSGPDTDTPRLPDEEPPLCALILNRADAQLAASIHIPGHFWYELNAEQLEAVLPAFSFPIDATVHYRGDGSIFSVVAYETARSGDAARHDELYTRTEIQFAPGEVVEDVIYDFEPVASEVDGVAVVAGVFDFRENDGVALYIASFEMDGIAYKIELHDDDKGERGLDRLTEVVNTVIRGGAPDLSVLGDPVIPELRDEQLTLPLARLDPDFGAYLPQGVPSRFQFESALRFINQERNSLSAHWYVGYDHIAWSVSKPTEYDRAHIVSAQEEEKYDLSLYPIPRADSVPDELREYVDHPVFQAEELSLDLIKARAYQIDDRGDTPGWRMDFSVWYDEVVVSVNVKGLTPEQVWELFEGLGQTD